MLEVWLLDIVIIMYVKDQEYYDSSPCTSIDRYIGMEGMRYKNRILYKVTYFYVLT